MQYREYQPDDLPPNQSASELASPWSRLAAAIIDYWVVGGGVGIIAFIVGILAFSSSLDQLADDGPSVPFILWMLTASLAYKIVQWVLLGTRGQTIGKIALSIRIVDAQTGEHPGWPRLVLLRDIVNWILTIIPLLGVIYWIVDSLFIFRADHRTIHDLYSGTRVDKL